LSSARKPVIDSELIERVFDKLYEMLIEAYYSTPPHIASRPMIKRSVELVHHLRVSLKAQTRATTPE